MMAKELLDLDWSNFADRRDYAAFAAVLASARCLWSCCFRVTYDLKIDATHLSLENKKIFWNAVSTFVSD